MTFWLLLLALAQPGDCSDRSPGLSQCVEYNPRTVDKGVVTEWSCVAVCYSKSKSKRDGGTDANTLRTTGPTKDACLASLQEKCK